MEKSSLREVTLEKIARSIEESWTLEQLVSTEQFLALYYIRFDFQSQYLQQEWKIDNHIREKKQLLTALEGAKSIAFDQRRPSLKRLESFVKNLSQKEFQTEWAELQIQLAEVGVVEISLYPAVCERTATIKSTLSEQTLVEEFA